MHRQPIRQLVSYRMKFGGRGFKGPKRRKRMFHARLLTWIDKKLKNQEIREAIISKFE